MNTQLAGRIWQPCLSSLQLDRFLLGELPARERARTAGHVASCAVCSAVIEGRKAAQAEELPPLRASITAPALPAGVRPPGSLARRLRWSGAGLAAAASLLLFLRLPETGRAERSKGLGAPQLSMYVQHAAEVRRAGPGEQLAAGDAVRFAVTLRSEAFVAVLSRDPGGHGSVYFPLGPRAERVQAGADLPLPGATRLDETLGEEQLLALFCAGPVELEPVRRSLEAGSAQIPNGCEVSRWSFVKR